jgi:NADH-quinone oxidoreductase subunit F
MVEQRILLKHHAEPGIDKLDVYRKHGGYEALHAAYRMRGSEIIERVERSGLRGRGGAGYPAASKWKAVADQTARMPHYFVCNIAEGEPGSFKDRALCANPHQVLEATAISAYSIGAEKAFVYLRGAFVSEEMALKRALGEAIEHRLMGSESALKVDVIIHRGEDSYIAGEETAMLESLEGKRAIPRSKPPRPHEYGLWDSPTVVNNVETICNIIPIILQGADAFRAIGTTGSSGTKLFCLSGQIARPGIYELPLGVPLLTLLNEFGGGAIGGHRLRAVFPGGFSTPILPVERNPQMDFESLKAAGTALGTGGVIVLDDSADIGDVAIQAADFFARESCGTCPPCTLGTAECLRLLRETKEGVVNSEKSLLKIRDFCEMMKFRGNCAHDRAAAFTLLSILNQFPDSFSSHPKRREANGLE